jgi:hypothetical protein
MLKGISLVLFIGIFFISSCRQSLKSAEYVNYINNIESGLKKTLQVDGFEFCMQYRPYDYIMLMENKGNTVGYDAEKRMADLKGSAWFSITLKRADYGTTPLRYGISSIEEYNSRLNYFLNKAKEDIWLVYDKDTLRPVSYLFENNFNLVAQETMIVGFYLPKGADAPKEKMQLSYNDQVFKNGIIKATYTERSLKNIPNLLY